MNPNNNFGQNYNNAGPPVPPMSQPAYPSMQQGNPQYGVVNQAGQQQYPPHQAQPTQQFQNSPMTHGQQNYGQAQQVGQGTDQMQQYEQYQMNAPGPVAPASIQQPQMDPSVMQQQQQPMLQNPEQNQEQSGTERVTAATEAVQQKLKGFIQQAKQHTVQKPTGPNLGFKPTAKMAQIHEGKQRAEYF